jgi:hypothetical protein
MPNLFQLPSACNYFDSHGIMSMVSIGVSEIFPLMKWDNILDLTNFSFHIFISLHSSSLNLFFGISTVIGNFIFGIQIPKTTCCSPHIWFNFDKVASSSLTRTSRKLVVAIGPFAKKFQHQSSMCPMPK